MLSALVVFSSKDRGNLFRQALGNNLWLAFGNANTLIVYLNAKQKQLPSFPEAPPPEKWDLAVVWEPRNQQPYEEPDLACVRAGLGYLCKVASTAGIVGVVQHGDSSSHVHCQQQQVIADCLGGSAKAQYRATYSHRAKDHLYTTMVKVAQAVGNPERYEATWRKLLQLVCSSTVLRDSPDSERDELYNRAGQLGHRYRAALGPTLAALRELREVSSISAFDFNEIRGIIARLCRSLTEEKRRTFFADLTTLHTQASTLSLIKEADFQTNLAAHMAHIEQGLQHLCFDESAGRLQDVLKIAQTIESSLRALLTSCAMIEQKVTREGKDDSPNPLRR